MSEPKRKTYRVQWRPEFEPSRFFDPPEWKDLKAEEYAEPTHADLRLKYWKGLEFPIEFRVEEGTL